MGLRSLLILGLFWLGATSAMTMNFSSIGTKEALRYLAQAADKNIIVSDKVVGELSLSLKGVSWQQALQAILQSQNLVEKQVGGVIYIAPNEQAVAKDKQAMLLMKLSYAKADSLAALIKPQLAQHGVVSYDDKMNVLIVKADRVTLSRLEKLVRQLDKPVPEVRIAAQVVSIDSHYINELGVRFGITSGHHLSGTLAGANELVSQRSAALVPVKQRLAVDFPAAAGAAHLGLALFKVASDSLLDMELSALQSQGHAQIIASPELMAVNQQVAEIQSGQEIPYQEKAGEGATSVAFKKAVLGLKVTPQLIPGGKVLLHLEVTQDKQGSVEVLGEPTIDTRQISTNVLLRSGQTVVLGGIYEQGKINNNERVPFIGSLPIIGHFFRYKKLTNERRELLIFVTPTIESLPQKIASMKGQLIDKGSDQ